jgi:GTP-binding protein Era
MTEQVRSSIGGVDAVFLIVEPFREAHPLELTLLDSLKSAKVPVILVINKVDALKDKTAVMKKTAEFCALYEFAAVVPISASQHDGVDILLNEAERFAVIGPHFFEDDTLTDQPERTIVGELVRESVLLGLDEEIPHGVGILVEEMKERTNGGIVDISVVIYCEKNSHKGIIIGKGGSQLKKIATQAREEIEGFLGTKVNLQCFVKVREDWRNRAGIMRTLGYK